MSNPKIKLSNLSRDEKLALIDALAAKKRVAKRKRSLFKPHDKCPQGMNTQMDVALSKASEKFVFCGNGWGKTAFAANQAMWWIKGYNPITREYSPVPAKVVIVLDRPEKVADVWLPEFNKWFEMDEKWNSKDGKPYVSRISFPNGSEIRFMFHLQELLAAESVELDYVIFDEPPPRALYIALMRGQRKKGSVPQSLLVGTPLAAPWLRTDIYEPWLNGDEPDVECFRGATEANASNLADGYLDRFSKRLSAKEKRIRLLGEFFDLEGLALAHLFNRMEDTVKHPEVDSIWNRAIDEQWPCLIAIDPHPSKKHHLTMLAVPRVKHGEEPNNKIYVLFEMAEKMTARNFTKEWIGKLREFNIKDIVCDSLGSSDSTGNEEFKSFIAVSNEVLQGYGLRMRSTTYAEKNDEAFIDCIQDVLAQKNLVLSVDCYGCIKDIENVQWQKFRGTDTTKPKLDIEHKDFLATLKYGLAANPRKLIKSGRIKRTSTKGRKATSFSGRLRPGRMKYRA